MNHQLSTLSIFLCALLPLLMHAQAFQDYRPFSDNPAVEKQLMDVIAKKYQQDVSSLAGNNKKYIADIYKERYELIRKKIEQKELITDAAAQDYLSNLLKEILQKNSFPGLSSVRILFSRDFRPNAVSMGEGTIIFNIGLFNRMQNEAQAIFVICHELAHYKLDHSNNGIRQYVETVHSDEFQKQLKNIRNTEYGKNSQVEELALKLSFKSHRYSREFEQAADSMAIEFMKNTAYDLSEAISCLALLDSADKNKYEARLNLEQLFNSPDYPFRKKWLASNGLAFSDTKEELDKKQLLEDSLKTHPDCKIRMARATTLIKRSGSTNNRKFIVDENKFRRLKEDFDYELLEYAFESEQVSKCLYLVIQMMNFYPGNSYLMGMTGKCLNRIYKAQKDHELGKIVDLPNPAFDEEYNTLLRFLQNIRLPELGTITYNYLKKNQEVGKTSEEFVYALILSKENNDKPEEKKEWVNYYQSHFSKRKYNL